MVICSWWMNQSCASAAYVCLMSVWHFYVLLSDCVATKIQHLWRLYLRFIKNMKCFISMSPDLLIALLTPIKASIQRQLHTQLTLLWMTMTLFSWQLSSSWFYKLFSYILYLIWFYFIAILIKMKNSIWHKWYTMISSVIILQ